MFRDDKRRLNGKHLPTSKKREQIFVFSIDNEHTFCYSLENKEKNKRSTGQERRVVK